MADSQDIPWGLPVKIQKDRRVKLQFGIAIWIAFATKRGSLAFSLANSPRTVETRWPKSMALPILIPVVLQGCPQFNLTFLPIHRNGLLENNYLKTSLKTALFFNPISVEITAYNCRMIYLSILICCYITGHFLHSWFHQSCNHLSSSAARAHLTEPHLLFILRAVSRSCQF